MREEMNHLKEVAIDHLTHLMQQATYAIEQIEYLDEDCEMCDGSGEEECGMCGGAGEEACEDCDGEGYLYDDGDPDYEAECTWCDGMGYIDCGDCGGDGQTECTDCAGSGDRDDDSLDDDIRKLVHLVDSDWK